MSGFGVFGAVAGVVLVVGLIGTLAWSAARGAPTPARHPQLFTGSVVLDDYRPLTVVDAANAAVTVRLQGVYSQVAADNYQDIEAVPVDEGTMLVNTRTGTFNLLGNDNYVIDAVGAGIGLGKLAGATGAGGFSDGADAYIVRYAPHSTVSLVDQATVTAGASTTRSSAAGSSSSSAKANTATVTPRGFTALTGAVANRAGAVTVDAGNLWALVGAARGCQVVEARPVATGHDGLLTRIRAQTASPCGVGALASSGAQVGLATPGHVRLYGPKGTVTLAVSGTARASSLLPVTGTAGGLRYLAHLPSGWSVFGVTAAGQVVAPQHLARVSSRADLAPPVESAGRIYTIDRNTIDRNAIGAPQLWTVDPTSGAVATVPHATRYPAKSAHERASFAGAQVLVDGPRVIYNNPDSLLAVVVFTDGTHTPVVVDKSTAVDVSAVGPGDIDAKANQPRPPSSHGSNPAKPTTKPAPAPQPVSQQVTCANTTQTPYAPQISSVGPSSESALISWSYQLLDEQDCEPDSWSVQVTALGGAAQPGQPIQVVNGQNQLQFTGLRPATTYKIVVTAYINRQSTPSAPATFTTDARGPDAPTSVTTTADGNGNWIVSWTPCTASDCYVSADSWTVIGTSCGSAYVGQPPTAQVPGGQDQVTIPAGAALGSSVSFSVQGSTSAGLTGPPTPDGACTEVWQAPNPSDIALGATAVPAGTTVTATLQVRANTAAVEAFGSDATQFTYSVGGVTVGPTAQTSVTVPNLPAGVSYTPTVAVAPANHPTTSVTVSGAPFTQTIPWPTGLALHATATVEANPNSGQVTASFDQLPTGSFSATGQIVCGSVESAMSGSLNAGQLTLSDLNLDTMGGNCSLSLTLADTSTPNPYGVPTAALTTAFTIGSQPSYGFSATVDPTCTTYCSQAATVADVAFAGGAQPTAGVNWTVTPAGACGNVPAVSSSTPAFPYQINLSSCANPQGAAFIVRWQYLGVTQSSSIVPLQGTFGTTTTTTTTLAPTTTTPPPTPSTTACIPVVAEVSPAVVTTRKSTTTAKATTTTAKATTTSSMSTTSTTLGSTTSSSSSTTTSLPPCSIFGNAIRGDGTAGGASGPSVLALASPGAATLESGGLVSAGPAADGAGALVIEVVLGLLGLGLCSGLIRGRWRRHLRRRATHQKGTT